MADFSAAGADEDAGGAVDLYLVDSLGGEGGQAHRRELIAAGGKECAFFQVGAGAADELSWRGLWHGNAVTRSEEFLWFAALDGHDGCSSFRYLGASHDGAGAGKRAVEYLGGLSAGRDGGAHRVGPGRTLREGVAIHLGVIKARGGEAGVDIRSQNHILRLGEGHGGGLACGQGRGDLARVSLGCAHGG